MWFTGLSSAGKTSISAALQAALQAQGQRVEWLDGDAVRRHLSRDLGFSAADRNENVRRIAKRAAEFTGQGAIVLVSAISPYRAGRDEARRAIGNFLEVWVRAPLEVCESRDVKGLYQRARRGEVRNVTGIDDPYEPPLAPEVECRTDRETLDESVAKVRAAVESWLAGQPAAQ